MRGRLIAVTWQEGGPYLPPPPLAMKALAADGRFYASGRVVYVHGEALLEYRRRHGLRPAVRRETLLDRRRIRRTASVNAATVDERRGRGRK
jgi:hypothetical protein